MKTKRFPALCGLLAAALLISSCGGNETGKVEVMTFAEETAAVMAEITETSAEKTEVPEETDLSSETSETADIIYAHAVDAENEETFAEETSVSEEETDVSETEETSAKTTTAETKVPETTEGITVAPETKAPETSASASSADKKNTDAAEAPAATAVVTASAPKTDTSASSKTYITILGPNMLYVGESFDFKYYIGNKKSKKASVFWECRGDAADFDENGTMTAKKKGDIELKVTDVSDGISASLTVHCVDSPDDVDFIVKVNGIPIANKTYPVPKNYNPGGLTKETYNAFNELVAGAAKDGISITFISGFRSYNEQVQIYKRWQDEYGGDADRISARPGYSEHQLGLAIDVNSIWMTFADTPEAKWLAEHCYEYGFILRYPSYAAESITGYAYEPWHIRYLGKDIAAMVHERGLTLEECLGIDSYYRD